MISSPSPGRKRRRTASGAGKASETKTASKRAPRGARNARGARAPGDDDITGEVMEFIAAIDAYRKRTGRPFPTWSEILRILKDMGYRRA